MLILPIERALLLQKDAPANSGLHAFAGGGGSRRVVGGFTSESSSISNFSEEDSLAVKRRLRGEGVTAETLERRLSSSSDSTVAVICVVVVVAVFLGAAAFVYFRRRRKSRADRRGGFGDEGDDEDDDAVIIPSAQPPYALEGHRGNVSPPDCDDVVRSRSKRDRDRDRDRSALNPTLAKPKVVDKRRLIPLLPSATPPREERNPSYPAGITEPFSTSRSLPKLSTVQDDDGIEQAESRQGSVDISRRKPSLMGVDGVSLAEVLLDAAKEIADHSSIPIVGEAASLVSILVRLFANSMENPSGLEVKLKRCRSIVLMLRSAAKVLGKVSEL